MSGRISTVGMTDQARMIDPARTPPAARLEVVLAGVRTAVLVIGATTLTMSALAAGDPVSWPVAVHLVLALLSALSVLPLLRIRSARAVRRTAVGVTLADLLVAAAYSAAFAEVAGAGSSYLVFVLLAGPVRWGLRGALVTGVPVAALALAWPQVDASGTAFSPVQTLVLVVLFAGPAALLSDRVRRQGARLRQAQEQFRAAFEHASIGMVLLDSSLSVVDANRSVLALLGVGGPALVGSTLDDHVVPADRARLRQVLAGLGELRPSARLEVQLRRPDGGLRWGLVAASVLGGGEGVPSRVVVQIENVTGRRQAEERLAHSAAHDALTGLPNRALLHSRLEQALHEGRPFAVLFLDLDRFKVLNDGLGHAAGDELLVTVADRLRQLVRPGDLVARLGGDEFVVLAEGVATHEQAQSLAERGLARLRRTRAGDGRLPPSGSVGVALPSPGCTPDTLLRDADTAMYAAKADGGGCVRVFTDEMRRAAVQTHGLEIDLRRSVRDDALSLAYQPVVELGSNRVVSMEALLRWTCPERGLVPASDAIAVAEQSDLICELGVWVLRRALRDAASWCSDGGSSVGVAVNIGVRQLLDPGFCRQVGVALRDSGLAPGRLTLELTETSLVQDVPSVVRVLEELRCLGVGLAIDDFGTGHASLTYLARFPVDEVKVDRSFIAGVCEPGGDVIVSGVVAMAHAFGLRVVAEGAETVAQIDRLRALGCDRAQGYVLARPVPVGVAAGIARATGLQLPAPRPALAAVPAAVPGPLLPVERSAG